MSCRAPNQCTHHPIRIFYLREMPINLIGKFLYYLL